MEEKNLEKKEEGPVISAEEVCNREQALRTIRLLEKGTRQAFLDGEVSVGDTEAILDRVKEAKERCMAGDVNACLVLDELVTGLMGRITETV